MRMNLAAGLLACGLILCGCSRQDHATEEQAADATMAQSAPSPAKEMGPASGGAPASPASAPVDTQTQLQSAAATQQSGERRFIRTASAEFRVRDVYRSALAIEDLVAQQGGFVASNRIETRVEDRQRRPSGDGRLIELSTFTVHGRLQVRMPSERTQTFLRALAQQVEFLDSRNFDAVDAQFELLRQRLAYARHQDAQRALADVAAERGKTGEKVDAVGARVDAQTQRDEATLAQAALEDRIAFATIDLSLYQSPQVSRTDLVDVDQVVRRDGPGFFARLGHALQAGWFGALDVLIALSLMWPLWLGVLLAAIALRQWRRRKA
jgi:hypothetical protein